MPGAVLLASLASACAHTLPANLPRLPEAPIDRCDAGGSREAILTAPFSSSPGFARVGLRLWIAPNDARILQRPATLEGARVTAALVERAHEDHLTDVPSVIRRWKLGSAPVHGTDTAVRILHAAPPTAARSASKPARATVVHGASSSQRRAPRASG